MDKIPFPQESQQTQDAIFMIPPFLPEQEQRKEQGLGQFKDKVSEVLSLEPLSPQRENSQGVPVLVISSEVGDAQLLKKAALAKGTVVVEYDAAIEDEAGLYLKIQLALENRGKSQASRIAFANHGRAGSFSLFNDQDVNINNLKKDRVQQEFWKKTGDLLSDKGEIHLLGCEVAATQRGRALIDELEHISGKNVAASTDKTGNVSSQADWELETDQINIQQLYFDADIVANWTATLAETSTSPAYSSSVAIDHNDYPESFDTLLAQNPDPEDLISALTLNMAKWNDTSTTDVLDLLNASTFTTLVANHPSLRNLHASLGLVEKNHVDTQFYQNTQAREQVTESVRHLKMNLDAFVSRGSLLAKLATELTPGIPTYQSLYHTIELQNIQESSISSLNQDPEQETQTELLTVGSTVNPDKILNLTVTPPTASDTYTLYQYDESVIGNPMFRGSPILDDGAQTPVQIVDTNYRLFIEYTKTETEPLSNPPLYKGGAAEITFDMLYEGKTNENIQGTLSLTGPSSFDQANETTPPIANAISANLPQFEPIFLQLGASFGENSALSHLSPEQIYSQTHADIKAVETPTEITQGVYLDYTVQYTTGKLHQYDASIPSGIGAEIANDGQFHPVTDPQGRVVYHSAIGIGETEGTSNGFSYKAIATYPDTVDPSTPTPNTVVISSDPVAVDITIIPQSYPPLPISRSLTIFETETTIIPLEVNNSHTATGPSSIVISELPTQGNLFQYDVNATGKKGAAINDTSNPLNNIITDSKLRVIYEPNEGATGTDSFQMTPEKFYDGLSNEPIINGSYLHGNMNLTFVPTPTADVIYATDIEINTFENSEQVITLYGASHTGLHKTAFITSAPSQGKLFQMDRTTEILLTPGNPVKVIDPASRFIYITEPDFIHTSSTYSTSFQYEMQIPVKDSSGAYTAADYGLGLQSTGNVSINVFDTASNSNSPMIVRDTAAAASFATEFLDADLVLSYPENVPSLSYLTLAGDSGNALGNFPLGNTEYPNGYVYGDTITSNSEELLAVSPWEASGLRTGFGNLNGIQYPYQPYVEESSNKEHLDKKNERKIQDFIKKIQSNLAESALQSGTIAAHSVDSLANIGAVSGSSNPFMVNTIQSTKHILHVLNGLFHLDDTESTNSGRLINGLTDTSRNHAINDPIKGESLKQARSFADTHAFVNKPEAQPRPVLLPPREGEIRSNTNDIAPLLSLPKPTAHLTSALKNHQHSFESFILSLVSPQSPLKNPQNLQGTKSNKNIKTSNTDIQENYNSNQRSIGAKTKSPDQESSNANITQSNVNEAFTNSA